MMFFKIWLQMDKNLFIKVEEGNGWLVWPGKSHGQNRGFSYLKTRGNLNYPPRVLQGPEREVATEQNAAETLKKYNAAWLNSSYCCKHVQEDHQSWDFPEK